MNANLIDDMNEELWEDDIDPDGDE